MGFEPTISTVTRWHVNRYTTGPPYILGNLILYEGAYAVNALAPRLAETDAAADASSLRVSTRRRSLGCWRRFAIRTVPCRNPVCYCRPNQALRSARLTVPGPFSFQ